MAEIHRTTLVPSKLELLTAWLPTRPWYVEHDGPPVLERAGGFRLDDPDGEVGIEVMLVRDETSRVTYQVPLAYRGAPGPAGDEALVGTMEHGVLGHRWAYDGTRDPVFVAELVRLLQGRAVPQQQTVSNAADPTVRVEGERLGEAASGPFTTEDTAGGTVLRLGSPEQVVTLHRVLGDAAPGAAGRLVAPRQAPAGPEDCVLVSW